MNADDKREALAAAIGADADEWVIDAIQDNRAAVLRALVPEHPDDLSLSDLLCDAQDRAEAAERKVARVEHAIEMAEQSKQVARFASVDRLRAALADEVDDSNDESSAQTTGHAGSQEGDRD